MSRVFVGETEAMSLKKQAVTMARKRKSPFVEPDATERAPKQNVAIDKNREEHLSDFSEDSRSTDG